CVGPGCLVAFSRTTRVGALPRFCLPCVDAVGYIGAWPALRLRSCCSRSFRSCRSGCLYSCTRGSLVATVAGRRWGGSHRAVVLAPPQWNRLPCCSTCYHLGLCTRDGPRSLVARAIGTFLTFGGCKCRKRSWLKEPAIPEVLPSLSLDVS